MKRGMNRSGSIYLGLLKLLIVSAVLAGLFFYIAYCIGEELIVTYCYSTSYMEKKGNQYAGKLQEYVEKNHVSMKDSEELTDWVREQKILSMQIYKNERIIYDSDYPQEESIEEQSIEARYYDWETYYTVQFEDDLPIPDEPPRRGL